MMANTTHLDDLIEDVWYWEDERKKPRRDFGTKRMAELIEELTRELARG